MHQSETFVSKIFLHQNILITRWIVVALPKTELVHLIFSSNHHEYLVLCIFSVPKEYHDLHLVFSKDKALSLPPHSPFVPLTFYQDSHYPPAVYTTSLSQKERPWKNTRKCLAARIIRPSSSLVTVRVFFNCQTKKHDTDAFFPFVPTWLNLAWLNLFRLGF